MKKLLIALILISVTSYQTAIAQNLPSLSDKPGTFEILSRTDYCSNCGFTKPEMVANLQKITELVNVIRKNPVLSDIKGFNGRARIYNTYRNPTDRFGVPSRISFEFSSFFLSKEGKVVFNTIEPPEWSLYVNIMIPGWTDGFNSKHGYFTAPLRKKTIDYGIDVYDRECFVIYDPSRPAYWIPVTVEEAFEAVREDLKNEKDPVAAQYLKEFIDKEYAEIPAADHNKRAYFGGNVSRISATPGYGGQDSIFPYIMKINPEYWDNSRPKSDIQIINFRAVMNKKYLKSVLDDCMTHYNVGSGCDLPRFELSFGLTDIRNLVPLIEKQ